MKTSAEKTEMLKPLRRSEKRRIISRKKRNRRERSRDPFYSGFLDNRWRGVNYFARDQKLCAFGRRRQIIIHRTHIRHH